MSPEPPVESAAPDSKPESHFVAFLPFLRLKKGYSVAGIDFLPLRDADKKVPSILESVAAPLEKILSGYVDRHGKSMRNCVVASIPGRGWDLVPEDWQAINWGASLLFFACWSSNDYFSRGFDHPANSTSFRIVGQRYSGQIPNYISISNRIRDGHATDGGYHHGELKFQTPFQCSVRESAKVDEPFLAALDAAHAADSPTIRRLATALPFVMLANTDDELMTESAEAILMGSAFDQLVLAGRRSSAYNLGRTFRGLFGEFGTAKVAEAMKVRPDIEIDPEYADSQPHWYVHRKWIEELYDVRSQGVHTGHHAARKWGWSLFEHLVMAAHVFPLTAKLLLAREGRYTLTELDLAKAQAVDKLLATVRWGYGADEGIQSAWSKVFSDIRLSQLAEKMYRRVKEATSQQRE